MSHLKNIEKKRYLFDLIDRLEKNKILEKNQLCELISNNETTELSEYLFNKARKTSKIYFGNKIYTRGLIEFTNYCKNDCYYCGIRRSNTKAERYRLTEDDILNCCEQGHELGFRTFVLQGGEDGFYTDEKICKILSDVKLNFPDCAITLSIGERSEQSYLAFAKAGADRFLLRHETADDEHYSMLHPDNLKLENRKNCLFTLKKLGYQVGTGFMVGSPFQSVENLADDLLFIHKLQPAMIGIGPFIPHKDTPFSDFSQGTLSLTLFLIGMLRLIIPNANIPSTTALGTIDKQGREKGILAGANVVMPNLSPVRVRKKYMLYDNKICTGEEAAECRFCLSNRIKSIGYELTVDRGDFIALDKLKA